LCTGINLEAELDKPVKNSGTNGHRSLTIGSTDTPRDLTVQMFGLISDRAEDRDSVKEYEIRRWDSAEVSARICGERTRDNCTER
jgi:hypothetical protein